MFTDVQKTIIFSALDAEKTRLHKLLERISIPGSAEWANIRSRLSEINNIQTALNSFSESGAQAYFM